MDPDLCIAGPGSLAMCQTAKVYMVTSFEKIKDDFTFFSTESGSRSK
jgi:hypothetical protein